MFLAMMAYLVLVLIRPQDYPDLVDRMQVPWQPIVLIVAAIAWILSPRKRFDAPQYMLLLLFFVALMLSNIANGWYGGAIEQIQKFAPVVLAFIVFANTLDTRRRVVAAMAMFTACAAVLALHGIDQASSGLGWTGIGLSQGTRIQYVGIFNDPNDLGLLFVTCLPMALYLSGRGGIARLFWWTAAGVLAYGIFLTNSRGTLVATLAVIGLYTWWRRGALVAGVAGAVALAALLALPSRMQDMDVSEASAMGRVESWYEGLQMFRAHPLFGVGADMYSDLYHLTAHNSFVLVLAETGVLGFTIWLAFVGYGFRMMLVAMRQPPAGLLAARDDDASAWSGYADGSGAHVDADAGDEPGEDEGDPEAVQAWLEDRAIALTLFLSLSAFFVAAFFLSRSYLVILYLLAAMVVAHYASMRDQDPGLPAFALQRDLLRWPLLAAAGVVALYLTVKVLLVTAA